ncbi:hypothetical protein IQ254_11520 [Nodosilinea sp. LEGE 07088]|uniref:WD40 repeat domain-containing protein n=1 Tax=Nodosilinea sp. LEGE 07088 TaxID=2777968 RepID=UPI0018819942|nr:hypothetical protein [Nodosilinea sp. LEGE 07088]MBE9137813.1 hypothetical protein [Nodosilinea sp. LEGE 07088]
MAVCLSLGNVLAAAFSPKGQRLATGDTDCQVRVWDVATGDCLRVCEGHQHLVSSLAFSADGGAIAPQGRSLTIATGSQDQTVRIWDAKTGDCLRVLIAKRLYEGMKLAGAKGLTPATRATLQMLGAIGD